MAESDSKLCRKCGEHKLFSQFYKNRTASDGLQSYCKPCMNADKMLRYREKHPVQAKPPIPTSKPCACCKVIKPLSDYRSHKAARDKHRCICRVCDAAARRARYRALNPLKPPAPPAVEKLCRKCGETKPLCEFHNAKGRKIGVVSRCKSCSTEYQKTYNSIQSLVRVAPPHKCCPKCNVTKPASDFFPNSVRKDQLSVYCQVCQHAYVKEKQYDKKRYEEMRDEELARGRVYRAANVEKVREISKLSARKNRHRYAGRIRASNRRRRITEKSATPAWANLEAIVAVYNEARRLEKLDGISRHVDHIIPINNKRVCGLHVEHNLQILTAFENLCKTNKFEIQ